MSTEDRTKNASDASALVPPGLAAPPTARALLLALKRRWLLATLGAVLGGATAAVVTWFGFPSPKFVAQTLLHVQAQPPAVVHQRGESRSDFQSYQRTQIALVKSRFVLNAALRNPEVAELSLIREPIDPIVWLQKELIVDFTIAPEILRIALNGDQPDEMKVLVAKITRAYLDEIVKQEGGKRRDRQEKLKELNERYQDTVRVKRRTLRDLIENVGTGDPATLALKQRFAQEQLTQSEKELLQLDSEMRKLQTELSVRQTKDAADWKFTDADLDELANKDPEMQKLTARKVRLQQDISETIRVAVRGDNEPRVQFYRKDLTEVETSLAERRKQIRPMIETQLHERLQEVHRRNVVAMTERVQSLEELRKALTKDIDRLAVESRSLNKGSLDIESYRQDITQTEETAKKVATELEAVTVEMKAVPRVTELESAFVAQPDDFKKRAFSAVGAGIAGLIAVVLAVAFFEYRSRRIRLPGDIVHGLGIKLVGVVPPIPRMNAGTEEPANGAEVHASEAWDTDLLDATRARLLHLARMQSIRAVLVTSAVAGEGKTTLASTLAASLAQAGRKTLLIDGDLRNPSAHRLFGLAQGPGVSEVLLGTAAVEQVVQTTAVVGLALVPAGQATREAVQVLPQENFGNMLKELRDQYDFIIVDSSPVLPIADALLIGQQLDGAILSVLHDVSQMHRVYAAYEQMNQMGIRVLGAVLSGTRTPGIDTDYRYSQSTRRTVETVAAA